MRIIYFCCLLFLCSCAKEIDYLKTHPGNPDRVCRISEFRFYAESIGWDTITLTYNQYGNPIRGDRKPFVGTGAPAYEFRYDKQQRLTDYIGIYSGGTGAEFWDRFTYENGGKTVIDSGYSLVEIVNGQIAFAHDVNVAVLTFDNQGRVNSETTYFGGIPSTGDFVYDKQGNLEGGSYDDKINFHRTNPVWEFLDLDYSVNNPFIAHEYNVFGLPTVIETPGHFFYNEYSTLELTYACPDDAGHGHY